MDRLAHELSPLRHLEQAEVGATLEEEQDAVSAVDRGLQQRGGNGLLGGGQRTPLPRGRADAHEGAAGVLHDGLDVVEVDVDQTRGGDELGDALDTLEENLIGLLEGVDDADAAVGDLQQPVVGDDDKGVDGLAEVLHAVVSLGSAATSLEGKGTGHHADGQRAKLAGDPGDHGGRTGAGATTLTGGDEDHVRAVQGLTDVILVVLSRLATDGGVRSGSEASGQVTADVQLGVRIRHEQCLGIGVDGDELHTAQPGLDHAVDGVDAATADAHHLDNCLVVLGLRHCVPPRLVPSRKGSPTLNLKLRYILMSFSR